MANLVEALRYKPKGRGFDSQYGDLDLPLTSFFRLHCGLGVSTHFLTDMITKDISCGGKGGRCIELRILSPAFDDCLEVLGGPQPPGALWGCLGL